MEGLDYDDVHPVLDFKVRASIFYFTFCSILCARLYFCIDDLDSFENVVLRNYYIFHFIILLANKDGNEDLKSMIVFAFC